MSFDDNEEEFLNEPVDGQMSIFEIQQNEPSEDEDIINDTPCMGQLDLFSYYNSINKAKSQNDNIVSRQSTREKIEHYSNEDNKNKSINQSSIEDYIDIEIQDKEYIKEETKRDRIEQQEKIKRNIENSKQDKIEKDNNYQDIIGKPKKNYNEGRRLNLFDDYDNDIDNNRINVNDKLESESNNAVSNYNKKLKEETKYTIEETNINISNNYKKEERKMPFDENKPSNIKKGNDGGRNDGGLRLQSIDEVLHNSMIPYSEFVLLDRALPRVEDGLKPVQRRILYTMLELGMTPDKAYRKCAKIVGDCLGKYHPHGDTSVYDAMVRMAQPFNMRGILVQGHGNFGSVDGDSAAAMRYTEAKLAPLAMELLRDLEKDTVKWSFNYDDTLKEPDTLPGRFPNLLVNGAVGIAVGLATNIPPHNLNEVIDGVVALIDKPSTSLKDMMKIIKGPDFPTGAIISGDELYQAYETGRGKITIRAKTHFEDAGNGKTNIVITEIPFQKNKASLLAKIVDIREDKKGVLLGIHDIKDESDRNGTRAVITVKAGYDANDILNLLFKYSDLQSSYGINMVAIADGKPKQLGLMEILKYYINYQNEVIVRRTKFDLNNAKERMHILEGLHIAIKNIDEVVQIIKSSPNTTEAKIRLRQRFNLSEKQAQAILDMRLARLTSLEVYKIEQEIAELKILIEKLTAILNSKRLQLEVIKEEMLEIRRKYSTPRITKIVKTFGEIDVESILEANKVVEETIVALTQNGTIKRMQPKHFDSTVKEYNLQMTESELHYSILRTSTDKHLVAFTNKGNACRIFVEDIKEAKWRDKGMTVRNLCKELDVDEKLLAIYEVDKNIKGQVIFATKQGILKRTNLNEYDVSKQKYTAIKLKDEDEVVGIFSDDAKQTILMVTKQGMSLNCEISGVPESGRVSQGVKGINLNDGDNVVFAGLMPLNGELIIATKRGLGKRFSIGNIELSQRARKGTKVFTLADNDDVMFVDVSTNESVYVLKFAGADNFSKKTTKEFFPDKKIGKGKSLSNNKTGNKLTCVYKFITQ